MTIILKRVELSNIRSHKHFVFEPKVDGLTSISGPNGSGKSSIVDSIAWCLFGTKPAGVSKVTAIIREGAELPKDKCFAQVVLQADNKTYKVERRLSKHGIVECEVSEQIDSDKDEWSVVAGPAVSHTEPFLRKLLKMDEKGFLAAILIQQKQVDQLISATPKERGVVIEKLTGISSVSQAATEAKQEYNSLKKAVKLSPVSETPLAKLREELKSLHDELQEKKSLLSQHNESAKLLRNDGVTLRNQVDEETRKYEEQQASLEKLATLKATLRHQEETLEKVLREKESRKAGLSKFGTEAQRISLHNDFKEMNNEMESLTSEKIRLERQISDLKASIGSHEDLLAKVDNKSSETIKGELSDVLLKVEEETKGVTKLNSLITSLKGTLKSIASACEVLMGDDGQCPTCLQTVADVSSAVDKLRESESEGLIELDKLNDTLSEKVKHIDNLSERKSLLESVVESYKRVLNDEKELNDANSLLTKTMSEIKTLGSEISAFSKVLANADREAELRQEYESLLKSAQKLSEDIKDSKKGIFAIERDGGKAISASALAQLRKKLDTARIEYQKIAALASNEKGEIKVLHERQKHMEEKIANEEEAVKRHQDLLKSVEIAGNSAQLLEEFKVNRIENSVPIIEAHASGLLSKFTEGKFTRLKLDGKFNASVVLADGTERSVGLLSGGELSAASIALRLAISIMLNGAGQNLIILDEVLVSQDTARSELILNTIKEACRGQIILIAHNDSINDTSDLTISL